MNENLHTPKKIGGIEYNISNTCAFDSISKLLRSSLNLSSTFKQFLEAEPRITDNLLQENQTFATFIIQYHANGVSLRGTDTLYEYRENILHCQFSKVKKMVRKNKRFVIQDATNCITNVHQLFENLMSSHKATRQTSRCTSCGTSSTIKKPVTIVPNILNVWDNGYSRIRKEMEMYFQKSVCSAAVAMQMV